MNFLIRRVEGLEDYAKAIAQNQDASCEALDAWARGTSLTDVDPDISTLSFELRESTAVIKRFLSSTCSQP